MKKIIKCSTRLIMISVIITIALFTLMVPIAADSLSLTIPRQVVLTWQGSTQTTMTITWRTDEQLSNPKILYTSNPDADIVYV